MKVIFRGELIFDGTLEKYNKVIIGNSLRITPNGNFYIDNNPIVSSTLEYKIGGNNEWIKFFK